MAAVKGAESGSFWVVSYVTPDFYSYLVTKDGVADIPIKSSTPFNATDRRGYLKISPNGKKIAIAHYIYSGVHPNGELKQGGDSSLFLYDFNDSTGQITNGIRLFDDPNDRIHPYGIEFSRQSTKLYVSTMTEQIVASDKFYNSVYQYDLENPNIPSTEFEIQKQLGFRGALQLAPNGKIYATVPLAY